MAFTRQILPWAAPGPLRMEAEAVPGAWVLRWLTDSPLPPSLEAEVPPDAPRSLAGLWLRGMADYLNLAIEAPGGCLGIRMPRGDSPASARKEP